MGIRKGLKLHDSQLDRACGVSMRNIITYRVLVVDFGIICTP